MAGVVIAISCVKSLKAGEEVESAEGTALLGWWEAGGGGDTSSGQGGASSGRDVLGHPWGWASCPLRSLPQPRVPGTE